MNNRGALFPVLLLLVMAGVFSVFVFTTVGNETSITTGLAIDDSVEAQGISGTTLFLITDEENPSGALFSNGVAACESVGRTCLGIKTNCSNIGEGSEWGDSSSLCGTASDEFTGCIYAAECDGDVVEGRSVFERGIDKVKDLFYKSYVLVIILIIILAIVLVAFLILRRYNEE